MQSRRTFDPRRRAEVIIDPRIMGGTACIGGTRIPVETILAYINAGSTEFEIYADFPSLPLGSIEVAVDWAEANGRSVLLPVRRMYNSDAA